MQIVVTHLERSGRAGRFIEKQGSHEDLLKGSWALPPSVIRSGEMQEP